MRGMRFGFGLGGGGLAGEGVGNVVVGAGVNVDAALCTKTHTMRAVTLWWIMVLLSSPTMSMPNSWQRGLG